jgi:hypothetical protein
MTASAISQPRRKYERSDGVVHARPDRFRPAVPIGIDGNRPIREAGCVHWFAVQLEVCGENRVEHPSHAFIRQQAFVLLGIIFHDHDAFSFPIVLPGFNSTTFFVSRLIPPQIPLWDFLWEFTAGKQSEIVFENT